MQESASCHAGSPINSLTNHGYYSFLKDNYGKFQLLSPWFSGKHQGSKSETE